MRPYCNHRLEGPEALLLFFVQSVTSSLSELAEFLPRRLSRLEVVDGGDQLVWHVGSVAQFVLDLALLCLFWRTLVCLLPR